MVPASAPGVADLVRIRDERWRVVRYFPHGAVAVVEVAGDDRLNRGTRARFILPFETIERIPASRQPRVVGPRRWRHAVRESLRTATAGWAALRTAAAARLDVLPFQLEPALAMLHGDACRFLLADAVGLGKTVQAALMVAELLERWPGGRALVVTPASLREQWRDELWTRFSLKASIVDAAGLSALSAALPAGVNPWSVPQVAITSIDYVKRPEVMLGLEALLWDGIVIDEAHNVSGRSDRAAAASLLARRSRIVVMLTATPHSGNDDAFRRLCQIGAAGDSDRIVVFHRTRGRAHAGPGRREILLRVHLSAAERAMHEALVGYTGRVWAAAGGTGEPAIRLAMAVLTRRACSSASSLARSVERRLALLDDRTSPGAQQLGLPLPSAPGDDVPDAVLATAGLASAVDERAHLEWVLLLAREARGGESKVGTLRRLLARIDEPAIVFTEYRDTLEHLAAALVGVRSLQLHGGMTVRERLEVVNRFTTGGHQLLLATDAASEGLNLHHRCRLVVNLEIPWTPGRVEQRVGRVDRIGQRKRVHAVHLVAAGTGEERVLASLVRRQLRARLAAGVFERPLQENEVAMRVIGGKDTPQRGDIAIPSNVAIGDERPRAEDEAERLRAIRPHISRTAGSVERRPVAVRLCRRVPNRDLLWAYRLLVLDRDGRVLLETLLGAGVAVQSPPGGISARVLRALLEPPPALTSAIRAQSREVVRALEQTTSIPFGVWADRERRLLGALQHEHARIAALLVQGSLFGRHRERDPLHRQEVVDSAIRCAAERLDLLGAGATPSVSCELAFAIARL